MQIIRADTIISWERFYRSNLVNSLTGVKSANLIGTISPQGIPNLALFSSVFHLGSDPALIGYINRPRAAAPHTLANIESSGVYTINHVHPGILAQAHQTSAKYPAGDSEFAATGLTPQMLPDISAPFVQESDIKFALSLQEILPIRLNGTFLVIGKLECIILEKPVMAADGLLAIDQCGSLAVNGSGQYYQVQPLASFAYARPHAKTQPHD